MSGETFEFSGGKIAEKYDEILVPVMFEPWAELLLERLSPNSDWQVLDLATGTGIVASKVAARLDSNGSLVCADISPDMLAVARSRVDGVNSTGAVSYKEAPADQLDLTDSSIDAVYCQQGFQFFPDKDAAAAEIARVLKPGGSVAVATWCPVDECEFFGLIVRCLDELGLESTSAKMRIPFDYMPEDKLYAHFDGAGFSSVSVSRLMDSMVFEGGIEQAYRTVHGTPIGPDLVKLDDEIQDEFKRLFQRACESLTRDGITRCELSSLLLLAQL